jgi:hypothetical protein
MVTWAALTLGAWIFLKLVVPVAVDSARTAIVQSVKEAQSRKTPPAVAVPAPAAPAPEAAPVTAPEPATAKKTTTSRR